jgi:phage-related protein
MENNSEFVMRPDEVTDAAGQLDSLADRIGKLMQTEAPNMTVVAAGRDEVSQRVASTLNQVHSDFAKSSDQGINEMREVAATLRAHTGHVVEAEQSFAV